MRRGIGIIAAVMLVAGAAGCGGGDNAATDGQTVASTQAASTATTTPGSDETSATSSTSTCSAITDGTTEGPYYVTGTAALTDANLNYDALPGETITIADYVYSGSDKATPLANAVVDIWHADGSGAYWPQENGPAGRYTADQLSLRGHVVTDASGYYRFTTIFPGEYEGRARHIHVRASSADGGQDVITQLIMSRDETPAANDSIAQSLPPCHTMTFTTINGASTAFFDFHL